MAKRTSLIDKRLPLPHNSSLSGTIESLTEKPALQKQMLHLAIKAAYSIDDFKAENASFSLSSKKQLIPDDKINLVTSLMQSLQPTNAIEAALSAQFTATYIKGMNALQNNNTREAMSLLTFSQQTLDNLNRYRNKGMQQIYVQYNVSQGQVVNIKS